MESMLQKFRFQCGKLWNVCIYYLDRYARSKYATYILFLVAFAESSFFLIPPDVLLIPMAFIRPNKALWYACITTLGSVLGGILGYILGYFIFDSIVKDILINYGYFNKFLYFEDLYNQYGVIITFIAGFSPIPYKIATLAAGFLKANIFYFVLISILSRGLRFFLLAILIKFYHDKGKELISKNFYTLVKIFSIIILLGYVIYVMVRK